MKSVYIIGNTKTKTAPDLFEATEKQLTADGFYVRNLFKIMLPGFEDNEVIKRVSMLLNSTHVIVLPDYSSHSICLLEIHTAVVSGKEIIRANNTIIPERLTIYVN